MRSNIVRRLVGGVLIPVVIFIVTLLCARLVWGAVPAYLPMMALVLVMVGSSDYRRPARSLYRPK